MKTAFVEPILSTARWSVQLNHHKYMDVMTIAINLNISDGTFPENGYQLANIKIDQSNYIRCLVNAGPPIIL